MKFLVKLKWNPSIGIPKEGPVMYKPGIFYTDMALITIALLQR